MKCSNWGYPVTEFDLGMFVKYRLDREGTKTLQKEHGLQSVLVKISPKYFLGKLYLLLKKAKFTKDLLQIKIYERYKILKLQ